MAEGKNSDTCGNQRGECWSDLPVEILQIIAKKLDAKVDVSRSRAVCKSWWFSIPPDTGNSPSIKVRLNYFIRRKRTILTLWMRVVYHVAPQPASNSRGSSVNVTEVSFNSDCPALMLIFQGQLYYCSLGVDGEIPKCKVIKSLISRVQYKDVICHEGKFYVVSLDGRTIVVDSSLKAEMIATPISAPAIPRSVPVGIRKMYLVESFGELLLVMYLADEKQCRHLADETQCRHLSEVGVSFEIFKLNAAEKQWVEMATLDDRILFVGEEKCFSVLAQDFPGCKGNCIYFYDPCSPMCGYHTSPQRFSNIGVFDIDGGGNGSGLPRLYFLDDDGDSANIFCLPSEFALA